MWTIQIIKIYKILIIIKENYIEEYHLKDNKNHLLKITQMKIDLVQDKIIIIHHIIKMLVILLDSQFVNHHLIKDLPL